ncbi:heavy-metal-associated domain-containing protein [Desulfosediminicola flagellatus]|uniref:heavy-metal-associated domain-containing protein n=1 Tax=Desulfosediminicola flagellatus TaxID=2569541 RepID=UPI0010AC3776|nr:heavy metal-associated domain-containing protein [Desulfosediminicola flagellatus]
MATVKIKGMSCQHCVGSTKDALEKISGIENVSVDLDKGEATYEGEVSTDTVKQAITAIGFEVVE